METLKHRTFYGREKENLIYPIALANLVLHGIDQPNIWHGNTLTGSETYGGLFEGAPQPVRCDPDQSALRRQGRQRSPDPLRLQDRRHPGAIPPARHRQPQEGGRCGIVLDEGVLFRTNENAFVQTKRKLLDDCDLWCIVSLPGGRFRRGRRREDEPAVLHQGLKPTEKIWYYDLSDIKVGKKTPLTADKFEDFFRLLPTRGDSERSWTVSREQIDAKNYDLKAVNPNAKSTEDTRTPEELLDLIEAKGREGAEAIAELRAMSRSAK